MRAVGAAQRVLVAADADRMNLQPLTPRRERRRDRVLEAGGIAAVGDQDQHLVARLLFAHRFDREPDRVADRGAPAGEPGADVVEQQPERIEIEGQRHERVGVGAEQDQADAVAGAALDEIVGHDLEHLEAARAAPVDRHVRLAHAAGDIDRQHQVATADGARDGLAEPVGAARGNQQQRPENPQAPRGETGRGRDA